MYKNLEDLLAVAISFPELKNIIIEILDICQERNIKLTPSKFHLGKQVTFGGVNISHDTFTDAVCLDPTNDKIKEIEMLRMSKSKKECQSLVGMKNQLNSFIPKINHKLKNMRKMTKPTLFSEKQKMLD